MRIIAKKTIIDFYTQHSEAKFPLEEWYRKTVVAEWSCFADIKKDFNSVDAVGNGRFILYYQVDEENDTIYILHFRSSSQKPF